MASGEGSDPDFEVDGSGNVIIRTGFLPVTFPELRNPIVQHGKKLVPDGTDELSHVFNVEEVRAKSGSVVVRGRCLRQTSIRKDPYIIELTLDKDRCVHSAHCTCISGTDGHCKHVGAVVYFLNTERPESKTSQSCKWHQPSKYSQLAFPKGKTFASMFGSSIAEDDQIDFKQHPESNERDEFVQLCRKYGATKGSLFQMLTVEPEQSPACQSCPEYPDSVKELFFNALAFTVPCLEPSKGSKLAKKKAQDIVDTLGKDLKDYYVREICLGPDTCFQTFCSTVDQFASNEWKEARRKRVSASQLHKILHARSKENRLKYFMEL